MGEARKYICVGFSIASLWLACGVAVAEEPATMDLKVAYDQGTDSASVEWFPASPEQAHVFEIRCYDGDGLLALIETAEAGERNTTIDQVTARSFHEVEVLSLDASEAQVERTLRELFQTEGSSGREDGQSRAGLDMTLVTCDPSNFPFMFATLTVTSNGVPVTDFTGDKFFVTEDGRLQTDFFDVIPPANSGGARLADIIFLIDTSGSMGPVIASVQNNVINLTNTLTAQGIDYRLGLVQFGNASGANPRIVGGGLTDDVLAFQGWVSGLLAYGGYEPSFAAVRLAIEGFSFRPGAQKHFILITDEDSDDRHKQATIDLILANNVVVHAAVACWSGASETDYCDESSIRAVSGGLLFDVLGPYDDIIDEIGEFIDSTYVIRYRTDNPVLDGRERLVEYTVTDGISADSGQCSYIPGGAPAIQRTAETLALHGQPLASGMSPTISAIVTDAADPFVQAVTLFVRTTDSRGAYTAINMAPQGDDVYAAQIPPGFVNDPGVDYYIRATDGQVSASDPSIDPTTSPYQLAVMPNFAPVIEHTPIGSWSAGDDLPLQIRVIDDTNRVESIAVYHRPLGTLLWNVETVTYPGPPQTDVTEVITIPGAGVIEPALEYYIRATDDQGIAQLAPLGGANQPYVVAITYVDLMMTLVPDETCVSDPGPDAETSIEIQLINIDPNHPVKAANINLEWDSLSCWQVIDIVPAPGFDQFGSEYTGPGTIRYSVTRALGEPGIVDPQAIAIVTFAADVPPNSCCVNTIELTPGTGASATKVAGDDGYVAIPDLGDAQAIRIDPEPPEITCDADMVEATLPGVCYWKPGPGNGEHEIIDPVVTDNCEEECLELTYERSDGNDFLSGWYEVGETWITWTVLDCCSNGASCDQRILVEDHESPRIEPSDGTITVGVDENCVYVLPDMREMVSITDNCMPDPNVQQTPPPSTVFELGDHDVVINANDSHGNNAVANYTINVTDRTGPVFTLAPDDIEVYADAGKCTAKVEWNVSAVDECGAVIFECDPRSGTDFEIGTTGVTCTATDEAGNVTAHQFTIEVLPYWLLNVEVELKGYVSNGPFDRCVQFELNDCTGVLGDRLDLRTELTFVNGVAIGTLEIPVDVPCVEGIYTCARARDIRHSLWEKIEDPAKVYIGGTEFFAEFLGADALRLGNVNGDTYIDIVDWTVWLGQAEGLMTIPELPEDLCNPFPDPASDPIADVSGDGRVTAVDYGHLYVNNFQTDDPPCCGCRTVEMSNPPGPRTRLSMSDLKAMGMRYAAGFDYNGDGYVDMSDIRLSRLRWAPERPRRTQIPNGTKETTGWSRTER